MVAAGQPVTVFSDYLLGIETATTGLVGDAARARVIAEKLAIAQPSDLVAD